MQSNSFNSFNRATVYLTIICLTLYCWLSMLVMPDQWGMARYGIVTILLLLNLFSRHEGLMRGVYILLAMFAAIQYWHWRLTQTISFTGTADFAASITLVSAEFYSAILFFLTLFMAVFPMKRKARTPEGEWKRLPSVDVFIPTYNESLEIIKITALAAGNMIYPEGRCKIYILDDGGTEEKCNSPDTAERSAARKRRRELQEFCREAGIIYIAREENSKAKAGNLNYAFERTDGDLIAVFDCDHVPTQDFLLKTTHYFLTDPKLFLVQTPHFFINPDPLDKNLKMFYQAPSENEMFYRGILTEMDFWESAYFCGSAAVLRRRCLEEANGFSGETVTEDAETSLTLHSLGFRSIYLPTPLVCGITPDIFADFISQKIRWAQGMIQLFLLKKLFTNRGLRWYQKLCYFNCMFYWFFCFARLTFLIAPLFFLFFKLNVYNASIHQIMIYTVPYLMTLFITHNYLHGHVRWPLFSEIYEILQSLYILPAIVGVLINPRAPSFRVTRKGDTLSENRLSALAYPFHMIFWALAISLGLCVYKYIHEPLYRDTLLVTGCWILFNITMMFFTLGVVYERKQIRKFHRGRAWKSIEVKTEDATYKGELTDLSWSGAGIKIYIPDQERGRWEVPERLTILYELGDNMLEMPLDVKFSTTSQIQGKKGRHSPESLISVKIGGSFALDDSIESTRTKALLVYGDSERWQKFWQMKARRQNIVSVLFYLMKNASQWSVRAEIEFFHYNLNALKKRISRTFGKGAPHASKTDAGASANIGPA